MKVIPIKIEETPFQVRLKFQATTVSFQGLGWIWGSLIPFFTERKILLTIPLRVR